MSEQRCDTTDLLVSQCACRVHRGGDLPHPTDGVRVEKTFVAMYDGRCALEGSHLIEKGDLVGVAFLAERPSWLSPDKPQASLGYACSGCVAVLTGRPVG